MTHAEASTFYAGRTVLVTGHNGFKGAWLVSLLHRLGATVVGLSERPTPERPALGERAPNEHVVDVCDLDAVRRAIRSTSPDIVLHLAAHAITLDSYEDPVRTFRTNGMGTAHVLEAVRDVDHPCRVVIVTSDKCYENQEWAWGYRETDRLGGHDPYSTSKSVAELITTSYVRSYFPADGDIRVCTCRAGNVIGGGDESPHRVIPDCFRAWTSDQPIHLRHPDATRPWNFVLDVLWGYLTIAWALDREDVHGEPFNFGPSSSDAWSVRQVVDHLWNTTGGAGRWSCDPVVLDEVSEARKEHKSLQLVSDKVRHVVGWTPALTVPEALDWTARWYLQAWVDDADRRAISDHMVNAYLDLQR